MKITIHAAPENKKTILDLAQEQGFSIPCNCHGANACGGRQYDFPCSMVPHSDITISIPDTQSITGMALDSEPDTTVLPDTLLIDLGTTTVAMVFYHSTSQTVFHTVTFANPQREYGTDVISRIKYDVEFHAEYTLKKLICDEISSRYHDFLSLHNDISIRSCLIGGNTTMIHLLLGFPLDGMAGSPFTPYTSEIPCSKATGDLNHSHSPNARENEIFHLHRKNTDIYILPWLSAFIGGDIVSGMLYLDFDKRTDTCLLADLGTNGELALLHDGRILTASTAAGPAFEGGGLTCGCPAVPGAISDMTWNPIIPKLETIGNKLPIGICGSGAISILSQLIAHKYILPSGIISDKFPEEGILISRTASSHRIMFTSSDIRQMQLAIAAIGAGIDALCKEAGISTKDIDTLYLAGGFGHHIHVGKAALTGLFSDADPTRIISVGNSCLQGLASISSCLPSLPSRTERLKNICRERILADDAYFEQQFIRHMSYDSVSTR